MAVAVAVVLAATMANAGPQRLSIRSSQLSWFAPSTVTIGMTQRDARLFDHLCAAEQIPRAHCERVLAWQLPGRTMALRAFGIDQEEVSVTEYRRCVMRGACSPRHFESDDERIHARKHPATGVSIAQARQYCRFVGGRLPSEGEWERAGRGHHGRAFPWGNVFVRGLANHGSLTIRAGVLNVRGDAIDGFLHAAPIDALPYGASEAGVLNLSGNAREWVDDPFGSFEGTVAGLRTVKGGSWRSPRYELLLAYREPETASGFAADLGFRCAYESETRH